MGPPPRSARYNRYGTARRRNYRYRYYPHRRYYHVRGYRGAYYGGTFSGFLASLGVIFLLIGILFGLADDMSIFNVFFFIGCGLLVAGCLLSIMFTSRLRGMRGRAGDMGDPYAESSYGGGNMNTGGGNIGGTVGPAQGQQTGNRCQSCGSPKTGNFCESCGAR